MKNSNNQKTINQFFTNYYSTLITISDDYTQRYNYHTMDSTAIVSEIYLHVVDSEKRKEKISELIMLSAYTMNYQYDNRAVYYIANIIYNVTARRRKIDGNKYKNSAEIIYCDELYDEKNTSLTYSIDESSDVVTYRDFTIEQLLDASRNIINENNWYKHQVWNDYYISGIKLKELGKKYNLTITPIFNIIKDFNMELVDYLIKNKNKC